jgi:pyruvate dehydrogenase E2 component (dihydrolipoamide acetyltransferase)
LTRWQIEGYELAFLDNLAFSAYLVNCAFSLQAESAEGLEKFASYSGASEAPAPQAEDATSQPSSTAPPPAPAPDRIGPAVKKLLSESGLDASQIRGTGPRGIIVKGDVLAAVKSGMKPQAGGPAKSAAAKSPAAKKDAPPKAPSKAPAPDTPLSFEDIPNSQIRKVLDSSASLVLLVKQLSHG